MYVLQRPQKLLAREKSSKRSWQYWKLVSEAGRQRWVFNPPNDFNESFLETMSADFQFDKSGNPNTSDEVYAHTIRTAEKSVPGPQWKENPLMYPNSLSMNSAKSAFTGIRHLSRLQNKDGHWPGDYGGPLFLLPALIFASHITSVSFPEEKKTLMLRYMLNHQNADGGW
jgi:hypothetical protein